MADRYVVAAGGNWNSTATWSDTSGGAGGFSIPVAADNVFQDAASGQLTTAGTCTCANFDCTGSTAALTISSAGITVTGEVFKLSATATVTQSNTITLTGANAVADTVITTAGKTLGGAYTLNGVGKVFKLADAMNIGGNAITLTNGTFNSQGFDITCQAIAANNANTRTLTLTGSDLFLTTTFNILGAGLTFAAPDSIRFTRGSTNPTTVVLTANAGDQFKTIEISRAVTAAFSGFQITGAIAIEVLSFVGVASTNFLSCVISLPNNITIDECAFPDGVQLISSVNGTQRTITTATNEISFDGCMIRDIVISGGPAIATNSIDLGNNSGITFQNFGPATHEIVGITKDDAGTALPSCTVIAFKEDGGVMKEVSRTTSDGTTGAYTLPTPDAAAGAYTIVATNTTPDRADAMNGITPTAP